MFRRGQKVVCVTDDDPNFPGQPPKGSISTVANVYYSTRARCLCLELEEWPAPADATHDVGYEARHFRPVVEPKTGFAILEEIRKRESVPEKERVRKPVTAGDDRG